MLLKIAINAQIGPASGKGGIETFLVALIRALGELDGPEEFIIITPSTAPDWLNDYLGPNQKVVTRPKTRLGTLTRLSMLMMRKPVTQLVKREIGAWPQPELSDGFYESLGCDVIHFPYQDFTVCGVPAIYNPHDLQHLHFPEHFTARSIAWREANYRTGCQIATSVVVASRYVKEDVTSRYSIDPKKVCVIPWAPPTFGYAGPSTSEVGEVLVKYGLKQPYALYPAMTWPHKNHIGLIRAVSLLAQNHNLLVRFVCTGHKTAHWRNIEREVHERGMDRQFKFLGLVPQKDLRAIYRGAEFVFVPTLFEAASGPVFEAWMEEAAVACSNVTSLPQQAGTAALLFDPTSTASVADALRRMVTDEQLRADLVERGKTRLKDFSWDRTARAYRAIYRQAARRELSVEDQMLLQTDWMQEAHAKLKVEKM